MSKTAHSREFHGATTPPCVTSGSPVKFFPFFFFFFYCGKNAHGINMPFGPFLGAQRGGAPDLHTAVLSSLPAVPRPSSLVNLRLGPHQPPAPQAPPPARRPHPACRLCELDCSRCLACVDSHIVRLFVTDLFRLAFKIRPCRNILLQNFLPPEG